MTMKSDHQLVTAVDRALSLLDAFTIDDASLSLAELSRRAMLPKSSTLRLARSLSSRGYLTAMDGGSWRLGPATAWLGARYQVAFDIHNTIEPIMRELGHRSGHSISYFVHDGDSRIRLLHIPGETIASRKVRIGEPMPLEKGSPGQVLLAFTGRQGKLYETIRKRGYHFSIGEAKNTSASISAPVFGSRWSIVGALCIGIPSSIANEKMLCSHAPDLMKTAENLSRALSMNTAERKTFTLAKATWHPA